MIPSTHRPEIRAASPVVAIVLLVAVSVFLGVIVGAVALELEPASATPPTATFALESEGSTVVVAHRNGESIAGDDLSVAVDGTRRGSWASLGGHATVRSGDSVRITAGPDATVSVVWTDGGGRTAVLKRFDTGGNP